MQETFKNGPDFYFEYAGTGPEARCVRTWGDEGIYDHKLAYDLEARRIAKQLGVNPVSRAKINRRIPKSASFTSSVSQHPPDDIVETPAMDAALCARSFDFADDEVHCLFVSGSILTTKQLLSALRIQHKGDPVELMARLK